MTVRFVPKNAGEKQRKFSDLEVGQAFVDEVGDIGIKLDETQAVFVAGRGFFCPVLIDYTDEEQETLVTLTALEIREVPL